MPFVMLNKPFRVLSQFTTDGDKATLAGLVDVPGVYAAGRLDYDSEGLLVLTDDGRLQAALASPRNKVRKHYWVQVEGEAGKAALDTLVGGITLRDGRAAAISAQAIGAPPGLWPRNPPIRERRAIPDTWIDLVIDEGRNRQVRRMTAAVGLPTLRLIRHRIGPFALDGLSPGACRIIDNAAAWRLLRRG